MPVHGLLPLHVVLQAHVPAQVGPTAERRLAEDAGRLIAVHLEVLCQRSEVLVDAAAQAAGKTARTLHHHLATG